MRSEAAALHEAWFAGDGPLRGLRLSPSPRHTGWALGLVRSRTFGRPLGRPPGAAAEAGTSSGGDGGGGGGGGEAEAARGGAAGGAESGGGPVSLLMVPGVDLLNHSFRPNARFGVERGGGDGGGSRSGSGAGGGGTRLVVRASAAVAAGKELTISYGGGRPNSSLFASYGGRRARQRGRGGRRRAAGTGRQGWSSASGRLAGHEWPQRNDRPRFSRRPLL
jgi:hypothetical protein